MLETVVSHLTQINFRSLHGSHSYIIAPIINTKGGGQDLGLLEPTNSKPAL